MATLMLSLSMMGDFAEFERVLIQERIELVKKHSVYRGRKPKLSPEQVRELKALAATGIPKAKLARQLDSSREPLYRYLKSED